MAASCARARQRPARAQSGLRVCSRVRSGHSPSRGSNGSNHRHGKGDGVTARYDAAESSRAHTPPQAACTLAAEVRSEPCVSLYQLSARSQRETTLSRWRSSLTQRARPQVSLASAVTTILVTACGAPGAARLLRALRENGERE